MLLRAAILLLLVYGFYRWRRWRRLSHRQGPGKPQSGGKGEEGEKKSQPMLPCRHCGTFVPRDEALPGPGEHLFCSPGCRDAHPRD